MHYKVMGKIVSEQRNINEKQLRARKNNNAELESDVEIQFYMKRSSKISLDS